jgi:PAS domain S-box-containing protein
MLAIRETAERELFESNAFKRAVLDSMTAEIVVLNGDGVIVAVNEPWTRFARENAVEPGKPVPETGIGANYLAACTTSTGVASEEASIAREGIRAVLDGKSSGFRLEYACHSPDKERWFNMSVTPLGLNVRGAVVSHTDVTERMQAEARLRESEEKLRLFVTFAPSAIAMFDRDMRYLAFSRRWLADYALSGQDLTGRSHYEVFPELPQRWKDVHRRCLAGAVETCDEDPFPRVDGRVDWVRWEVHPWRTQGGDIGGIVAFSEIINRRKLAEDSLRQSEARLNEAQRNAQIGSWDWNPITGASSASDGFRRLFGLDLTTPVPSFDEQRGTLYPVESWEHVNAARRNAVSTGAGYDLVLEAHRADGTAIWIRTRGEAVRDGTGRITGLHGTIQDVTTAHRVEVALRESEERLRLALDAARMGTFDWDVRRDKVIWTRAQEALWGYAPGEFGGNYEALLRRVHPGDVPGLVTEVARGRATGDTFQHEFRVVWPDGSVHWVAATGRFEFDASGQAVRMRGAVLEVTAHKEAERKLQLHSAEMQGLAARLAKAEESERERLARELHDLVGSTLTALNLNMTAMRGQLPPQSAGTLGQGFDDAMALLEETTGLVRNMMIDLRPPMLNDFGLAPALRWHSELMATRTGLAIAVEAPPDMVRLDRDAEIALFRIAQEALNNAMKHASAHRVAISLSEDRGVVTLTIADDGCGFEPATAKAADGGAPHWGLVIMRERALSVGGRLRIDSAPGSGTRVIVRVPV